MENFWQHCLTNLKARFDAETFSAFIQPISLEQEGDVLYLCSPNSVIERWLRENVEVLLLEQVKIYYGEDAVLRHRQKALSSPEDAESETAPPFQRAIPATAPRKNRQSYLNPNQTFQNFVSGRANEISLLAAKRIAEGNNAVNPLFLYGSTGLGKTHLIQAIGNAYLKKFPERHVRYVSARSFLSEVVQMCRLGRQDQFNERYRNLDLLLVDDIQYIGGDKVRTQEEFFFLFNTLYESNKSVVISCDRAPSQMSDMPNRLTSRFSAGLPTLITPPEFELRVEIVRQKSKQRHLELAEEVICFIAENIKSNVRELEGAINRVYALAQYQGGEVTVEMCRNALSDLIGGGSLHIHPDTIKQKVAEQHHLHLSDLTSQKRHRNIVKARHIAIYLCRQMTSLSLPEIGRHFGKRNHTTILHSCRWVEDNIKSNSALWQEVKWLETSIRG